jgi:hypothetical protein
MLLKIFLTKKLLKNFAFLFQLKIRGMVLGEKRSQKQVKSEKCDMVVSVFVE